MTVRRSEKEKVRKGILEQLKEMTPEERRESSQVITEKVKELEAFQKAETCLFFASQKYEVDTRELIKEALKKNKKVALPVFDKSSPVMSASEIGNLEGDLVEGSFGILIPRLESTRPVNAEEIDLAIVPGVAFDRAGHRLGHGGGYYDHFLAQYSSIYTVGVAFRFQILDSLPVSPSDVAVQMTITD